MRFFFLALLAVITFVCAWLLLYQIGRLLLTLLPSAKTAILSVVTVVSIFIAWRTVRETID